MEREHLGRHALEREELLQQLRQPLAQPHVLALENARLLEAKREEHVFEAVKALPKLSVNDLSNPAARELFEELSRRLSASGPWSTTAAGMSDADAEQIGNMIRRLDQLVE